MHNHTLTLASSFMYSWWPILKEHVSKIQKSNGGKKAGLQFEVHNLRALRRKTRTQEARYSREGSIDVT